MYMLNDEIRNVTHTSIMSILICIYYIVFKITKIFCVYIYIIKMCILDYVLKTSIPYSLSIR